MAAMDDSTPRPHHHRPHRPHRPHRGTVAFWFSKGDEPGGQLGRRQSVVQPSSSTKCCCRAPCAQQQKHGPGQRVGIRPKQSQTIGERDHPTNTEIGAQEKRSKKKTVIGDAIRISQIRPKQSQTIGERDHPKNTEIGAQEKRSKKKTVIGDATRILSKYIRGCSSVSKPQPPHFLVLAVPT